MKDQKRKVEIIRSIENLQLSDNWVEALEDADQAQIVVDVITQLQGITEQWY
ncbi:hypothetical protein [Acinetobacter stercoris]|uniref:Uncharacterized protein n=1 Tax=Acinetobacter stercoris TaxID=2126983 RepID=A0A2U3N375_9GAMM|nr:MULTISPECIES: hypothetical protein [Acinetobacter]SPL71999.1 hypothetical protein KPC_3177 [Acinetobacter stercoris]